MTVIYSRHPTENEPKITSNKKTTVKEEEKLEQETEKETKLTAKETTTGKRKNNYSIF